MAAGDSVGRGARKLCGGGVQGSGGERRALSLVLEGIWMADIPLAERRRLMARAATAPLLAVGRVVFEDENRSLVRMEDALMAVGGRGACGPR